LSSVASEHALKNKKHTMTGIVGNTIPSFSDTGRTERRILVNIFGFHQPRVSADAEILFRACRLVLRRAFLAIVIT